MYNGIGLSTPRGSGTNGYVQKNLAFIGEIKDKQTYKTDAEIRRGIKAHFKEPNIEIIEHEKKRQVEVKCLEMQEAMEEQGYPSGEIDQAVSVFRSHLLEKMNEDMGYRKALIQSELNEDANGRLVPKGTHETAALNMLKNSVFKDALGIGPDFQEGQSLQLANQRKKEQQETEMLLEAQKKLNSVESSSDESIPKESKPMLRKSKKKTTKNKHPVSDLSSESSGGTSDSESDSDSDDNDVREKERKRRRHKHRSSTRHSSSKKHSHSREKRRRH